MLVTPLIALGSSQIDYVRAARLLGIPTALCVWSWDHLSSKALIRELPDRVFVWNDTQKREAIQLHGVPASQILVTGAQCFDKWFGRQPSRDRGTFVRQIGLPACERTDRPVVASGGVSSLDDVRALAAMADVGVEGAIIGKALYAGAFTLEEALRAAE